jgi:IS30 family transposase
MPKYTRNSGKEWTNTERRELSKLASENTPTRVIGLKLGRTESAVRTKAS